MCRTRTCQSEMTPSSQDTADIAANITLRLGRRRIHASATYLLDTLLWRFRRSSPSSSPMTRNAVVREDTQKIEPPNSFRWFRKAANVAKNTGQTKGDSSPRACFGSETPKQTAFPIASRKLRYVLPCLSREENLSQPRSSSFLRESDPF
jgi:hypothetical protein